MNAKPKLLFAELLLWVIAIGSIGACVLGYSTAARYQTLERMRFETLSSAHSQLPNNRTYPGMPALTEPVNATPTAPTGVESDGLIGTIDIPRLKISAVIEEGDDDSTLSVAVGHIPGTALPADRGNVALAAHRDTFFAGLGRLQPGDRIKLTTLTGTYTYSVESTRIVDPSATDVLAPSSRPILTLITCFPFHYVGSAPHRFVATARMMDPASVD
jgi:LPXTG-site transpeptidase (sortase) family protein